MRPLAGDAVMSIAQMIAAHPDVAGKLNEPLALAVRHAMFCSAICTSCADACIAEKMDLRQCIRACLRSEEHTSELQSLMRISYAVFCLKKKKRRHITKTQSHNTRLHS